MGCRFVFTQLQKSSQGTPGRVKERNTGDRLRECSGIFTVLGTCFQDPAKAIAHVRKEMRGLRDEFPGAWAEGGPHS